MRTLTKYAAAAGLAGALALGAAGSSVAAPQASPAGIKSKPEATTDISSQRRYRYANRRVYRRHYGPGPAVGAAIGLGILGAGVAAATAPRYYYSEPYPYYGGPAYYGGGYGYGGYDPYW
jgi:hypothetical protein